MDRVKKNFGFGCMRLPVRELPVRAGAEFEHEPDPV